MCLPKTVYFQGAHIQKEKQQVSSELQQYSSCENAWKINSMGKIRWYNKMVFEAVSLGFLCPLKGRMCSFLGIEYIYSSEESGRENNVSVLW